MQLFGIHIPFTNKAPEVSQIQNAQDSKVPEKAIVRNHIKYQQTLARTRQDISTWRAALLRAESLQFPNRSDLYRLYKDIVLDAHVSALMLNRKNAILSSNFIVTKKGKLKEDKTEFITKKWFYDFTSYALDSIFYGYSLIQFGDFKDDEFRDLTVIPREYVKPELGIVGANTSDLTGIPFNEAPYKDWCIGVGTKDDLGLLAKAAPLFLWKKGALAAWAEYTEIFGTPIRIGKTNVRNEETRVNMENMLKNMGTAAYGVFDTDDVIELIESNKNSASEIFDKLIERCNSELSKLFLGQTGTIDEKSFVGSAKVHEGVMQKMTEADQIFIENIYTYQLVPFLNKHGLQFNNLKIEIEADDELNLIEKSKIDIELLKTGLYTIAPDYILDTYGTPVIPVTPKEPEVKETPKAEGIQNKLDLYYGDSEL